jgi:hypothetical protein
MIDQLRSLGGSGVSEVLFNSEPDIIFELFDRKWLLSVKIGESPATLKQAFVQYQRHKDETKIDNGLILFLPESVRSIEPTEVEVSKAVTTAECTCLLDTPTVKDEIRAVTFPHLLVKLRNEVVPAIARAESRPFPLSTVLALLQQQVMDMMQSIHMSDADALRVITDKKLLSGIGRLTPKETADASRFLASYILLSQVLFLRLFSRARPTVLPSTTGKITRKWLRDAFDRILSINYRPIFDLDVLGFIPEDFARDTFHLIWGLEVESVRYELPGRLFHELMPKATRKMLAAFYTRPQAADLLARITIGESSVKTLDPACGSGTILVAAYRRKLELWGQEGNQGNPHSIFCEQQIAGADIMPFAVHLTTANLASMDPSVTISKAQVVEGDSLGLSLGVTYRSGVQTKLLRPERKGYTMTGAKHDVDLTGVETVLMNPPFTKVERGIRKFVDMERFGAMVGNEVGLWGHFIPLASEFLDKQGVLGAVLPVNLLRGRESAKIRRFLFETFTPRYILKAALNYGFSEWAEYRDVLVVAKKGRPSETDIVKFAIVKKDLKKLTTDDISFIDEQLSSAAMARSPVVDIDTHPIAELRGRFDNLMWFCGVSDFRHRDDLLPFISKASSLLARPPAAYFREGYRPVPKGVSSFMFLTRNSDPSRIEEAFLHFDDGDIHATSITARTEAGTEFRIELSALSPSLRTGVGLKRLDISNGLDYIAKVPYNCIDSVRRASGFKKPNLFGWKGFWENVKRELPSVQTRIVTLHRINPYSPSTHLVAFHSSTPFSTSNVLSVVLEDDDSKAKAFCAVLNSVIFWAQFFLLKEETTGRNINIRFYDFEQMHILPSKAQVGKLEAVYDHFAQVEFPSLRDQLDSEFEARYAKFWQLERRHQRTLDTLDETLQPHKVRLEYDLAICDAIGMPVSERDLCNVYKAIAEEMVITRGLTND